MSSCKALIKRRLAPPATARRRRLLLAGLLGLNSIDSAQIKTQNHQNNAGAQCAPGQIKDCRLSFLPGSKSA